MRRHLLANVVALVPSVGVLLVLYWVGELGGRAALIAVVAAVVCLAAVSRQPDQSLEGLPPRP